MSGYGSIQLDMAGYDMDGYCWISLHMAGYGWILMDMTGYGWIWLGMAGYGRIWLDMAGVQIVNCYVRMDISQNQKPKQFTIRIF